MGRGLGIKIRVSPRADSRVFSKTTHLNFLLQRWLEKALCVFFPNETLLKNRSDINIGEVISFIYLFDIPGS